MNKNLTCLLLIFMASYAQQEYRDQSKIKDVRGGAKLHVTYPPSLKEALGGTGQLKVSLGNFGHIQYGTTIGSHLTYNATNIQGCLPFESYFPHGHKIVLVEAGGCPITQKVRNIEAAGG
jgi:hypothetical protein